MNSLELLRALFWAGLVVFLFLFLSRRLTRDAVNTEEKTPGRIGEIVYLTSKWLTLILSLYLGLAYLPSFWPPRWMERRDQRKQVIQRVEAAGGWAKLVQDTQILLATNDSPYVRISPRWETNFVLPTTIATLKTRDVELSKMEGPSTALLHIFGYHSTGGRGQANYWLFVVEEGSEKKAIESLRSRFSNRTIRQITNSVFEVY